MNRDISSEPFSELPAGLVADLLDRSGDVGMSLLSSFEAMRTSRDEYRRKLKEKLITRNDSDLGFPPEPTTCGTDGSYGIERLLSADFVACAAVAVEGLAPPRELRQWPEPRHLTYVGIQPHSDKTSTVLRALMIGRELRLAQEAPHELVLLDGSMTLPLIYLNQALNTLPSFPDGDLKELFRTEAPGFLAAYRDILLGKRSDKQCVALPKYTMRREIGQLVGWDGAQDDRGMLSHLLEPGQFTAPQKIESPVDQNEEPTWHLNVKSLPHGASDLAKEIVTALARVHVLYYKPHAWLPALRLETAPDVALNSSRLAIVSRGIRHQCATPAMLEPYPVYLADRTVKALAGALPAFRHVATQFVSERCEGDIADVFLAMHGYRSESGA